MISEWTEFTIEHGAMVKLVEYDNTTSTITLSNTSQNMIY